MLFMPFIGNAMCFSADSITKIEIYSSHGVYSIIGNTRYTWMKNMKSSITKFTITDVDRINEIISAFCNASKIEDLDFDVYDPDVIMVKGKSSVYYRSTGSSPEGIMLIYKRGAKSPELIWLYSRYFDCDKSRYELPLFFWKSINKL